MHSIHSSHTPCPPTAQLLAWGWRVPFLTGSVLGIVGILLRTQTKGLQEEEEEEEGDAAAADGNPNPDEDEEHLPLHAPTTGASGGGSEASSLVLVGEGLSPAVLEADRTRDYHARHRPQHHATFRSVMRAAAGADKLRVGVLCVESGAGMECIRPRRCRHSQWTHPPTQ